MATNRLPVWRRFGWAFLKQKSSFSGMTCATSDQRKSNDVLMAALCEKSWLSKVVPAVFNFRSIEICAGKLKTRVTSAQWSLQRPTVIVRQSSLRAFFCQGWSIGSFLCKAIPMLYGSFLCTTAYGYFLLHVRVCFMYQASYILTGKAIYPSCPVTVIYHSLQ